jgi:hypothetical protein
VKKPLRLAVAALTQNVYVGLLTKDGKCFTDSKQDITSDFLRAVIDRFSGDANTIRSSTGELWKISVRKVTP